MKDVSPLAVLLIILVWILVVIALTALVRPIVQRKRRSSGKTQLDVIKEQYKRGEIDREEFEKRKKEHE